MKILVQAETGSIKIPPEHQIIIEKTNDYFEFLIAAETEQPDAYIIDDELFKKIEDELCELCELRYFTAVIVKSKARAKLLKKSRYTTILEKNAEKQLEAWINSLRTKMEEFEIYGLEGPGRISVSFPSIIRNRVIAVCKGKAADGGTTLATNLALRISMLNKRIRVVLIDGDIRNPSIADHLNLNQYLKEKKEAGEKFDFSEIIPLYKGKRLTDAHLDKITIPYKKNLDIICGSEEISKMMRLDEESILELFSLLRKKYNYVIVDCSSHINELITYIALVEESTDIIWSLTSDYCSRKRTVRNVRELLELGVTQEKVIFVLNKHIKKSPVSINKIRQEIKPVGILDNIIGFTPMMIESLDRGKPLAVTRKDTRYVEHIDRIISLLLKRGND